MAAAWEELNSRDPLYAALRLNANCGPVVISDQLDLYRRTQDDLLVSAIQKNGYMLYFTDGAVCDKDGNAAVSAQTDMVDAARLLQTVYELCMHAQMEITQTEAGCAYTLALGEDGMKSVASAIAPAAEDMDILFDSGSVRLTIMDGEIQSIQVSCSGNVKIMLSGAAVAFEAELDLSQESMDLTIPETVIQALK